MIQKRFATFITMLATLSYSLYAPAGICSAQEAKTTANKRYGIGVGFGLENGRLLVKQVVAGSPAETAGILPGDELIEANNVPLIGVAQEKIPFLLGGKENSEVILSILRDGKVLRVTAKRSFNTTPKDAHAWQLELENARKTNDKQRVLLCLLNITQWGLAGEPPIDPRPYRDEAWTLAHQIIPAGDQKWIKVLCVLGESYKRVDSFSPSDDNRAKLNECCDQLLSLTAGVNQTPMAANDYLLYFANSLDFRRDDSLQEKSIQIIKRCLDIADAHHASPDMTVKYLNALVWQVETTSKEATPYAERALRLTEASPHSPQDLQRQINMLAQLYERQKNWSDAIGLRLRVVNMVKQQGSPDLSIGQVRSPLQSPLVYLARDYEAAGNFKDALSTYRQIATIEKQYPAENPHASQMRTLAKIGCLEFQVGEFQKAECSLREAIPLLSHQELAEAKLNLAKICAEKHQLQEAQKYCQEVLSIYKENQNRGGSEWLTITDQVAEAGKTLSSLKMYSDALSMFDTALLSYKRAIYEQTPNAGKATNSYIANLYRRIEQIMNDYLSVAIAMHKTSDVQRIRGQIVVIKRDNYDPEVLKTSLLPILYTGTTDPELVKLLERRTANLTPPARPGIGAGSAFPSAHSGTGDIASYRREVQKSLREKWNFSKLKDYLFIQFRIDRTGKVISCKILPGGPTDTDKKLGEQIITLVQSIQFPPLPDWYQGASMQFREELSRLSVPSNN